ncbi:UNVERIFIED_CONTAM: hypothetical protein FKN15_073188 [Acipenser sinensis]
MGQGDLRKYLWLTKPKSLQSALQLAQEWEDMTREESNTKPQPVLPIASAGDADDPATSIPIASGRSHDPRLTSHRRETGAGQCRRGAINTNLQPPPSCDLYCTCYCRRTSIGAHLHLSCQVEGMPCTALVDTRSIVTLVRPCTFQRAGKTSQHKMGPMTIQLRTVTGHLSHLRFGGATFEHKI